MTIENSNFELPHPSSEPTLWGHLITDVPFAGETSSLETLPNLPTTSPNRTCNFYLHEITREGRMNDVKSFLESTLSREPHRFTPETEPELDQFCEAYSSQTLSALSNEDVSALKNYSGLGSEAINQIARGYWNYDILGPQTPDKVATVEDTTKHIRHAINSAPQIPSSLVTYRGTNLDNFRGYDITTIDDLSSLNGQFFLESGFTSTSLSPTSSFTQNKPKNSLHGSHNIEIEYIIPQENHETIGLLSENLSYYPDERELLIDKNSLSYISNVEISPDETSAKLQMILIPRQIYDPATR